MLLEYLPATQDMHTDDDAAPVLLENLPPAQDMHTDD
eukprot:COSAG03_NODE_3683_length_1880_cov_1.953958_2_plen_36_part_01